VKATVSVDLDNVSFNLEEDAFATLRSYLDRAGARLGDHPDRADVLAGLERSIAMKLGRARDASGERIGADEMEAALAAVGRVDGPALDGGGRENAANGAPRRRLYRLKEGRKIAGVCAGLAAFAEIDVSLIRVAFILGTFFTGGMLIVLYLALTFIMPIARTDEEIGAAHGGRTAI
jgi:phage shock protein C